MNFRELMEEVAAAIIAYDGERLANLFTEDGAYLEPLHGKFQGRQEIRRLAEDVFQGSLDKMKWDILDPVCEGDVGYTRWVFSFYSKRPGLEGRRCVLPGVSYVQLTGGKIQSYEEFFDLGMAFAQLGAPPEAPGEAYQRKIAELHAQPALAHHLSA